MSATEYCSAEPAKNQLLRDFRRRSVFDFCNTIGTSRTWGDVQLESEKRCKADMDQASARQSICEYAD
jgi:hypothetical protein